jgi:hypothetical protein
VLAGGRGDLAGGSGHLVEERRRRCSGDDGVGHGVRMPLVWIRGAAVDPALELDAAPLLDDVRRLVRRRVEIGRPGERHRVAARKRLCAERVCGLGRGGTLMRLDARDVVGAETGLDLIEVR